MTFVDPAATRSPRRPPNHSRHASKEEVALPFLRHLERPAEGEPHEPGFPHRDLIDPRDRRLDVDSIDCSFREVVELLVAVHEREVSEAESLREENRRLRRISFIAKEADRASAPGRSRELLVAAAGAQATLAVPVPRCGVGGGGGGGGGGADAVAKGWRGGRAQTAPSPKSLLASQDEESGLDSKESRFEGAGEGAAEGAGGTTQASPVARAATITIIHSDSNDGASLEILDDGRGGGGIGSVASLSPREEFSEPHTPPGGGVGECDGAGGSADDGAGDHQGDGRCCSMWSSPGHPLDLQLEKNFCDLATTRKVSSKTHSPPQEEVSEAAVSTVDVRSVSKRRWPRFEMLAAWKEQVDESRVQIDGNGLGKAATLAELKVRGSNYDVTALDNKDESCRALHEEDPTWMKHFIQYPGSPLRLCWDFLGAGLIFYDLFIIPLQVFDREADVFTTGMDWFTLIFWTVNIAASMCVGYVEGGVTIMVPRKILINYLRTWFLIDLVVVVPDWIFSVLNPSSSAGSSVRLLRILRLVRMVRLLRLLKLRKIMANLNDLIDSEYISIVANIVKMILLLMVINHFIACLWFAISAGNGPECWVESFLFDDKNWQYQYATSFHWSITQFTPASMHVQPMNLTERIFTILVVVFALVGFSYVVGSITGSLTQLRSMQERASKQFWNLRRYLKQNRVPLPLSSRIQRYLEHAWQRQQEIMSIKHVTLFTLLSDQLQCELQCELSIPHLSAHPLFRRLNVVSNVTMHRLANTAIWRKSFARSDTIFIPMENATTMDIVVKGRLQYHRRDSHGDESSEWVDKGEDWISEPILWTPTWVHIGGLVAATESEVMQVSPDPFAACARLNPTAHILLSRYCRAFMEWLNSEPEDNLTDIWQGEDVGGRVYSFMGMDPPVDDCEHIHWARPRRRLRTGTRDLTPTSARGSAWPSWWRQRPGATSYFS